MPINNSKNTNKHRARYAIAKAWQRFLARIIDIILLFLFCVGLFFAIIMTDPSVHNQDFSNASPWRYLLLVLISDIVFFGYFILLTYFWNGQTIGKWIFKLTTYNLIPTSSFFLALIKKEFLIWMITVITNTILGITLATLSPNDAHNFIEKILFNGSNQISVPSSVAWMTYFIQTLYLIAAVIDLVLITYMFVKNKKRSIQDHLSNTTVIKLIDINPSDPDSNINHKHHRSTRNFSLPGEVKSSALDEIDSLE